MVPPLQTCVKIRLLRALSIVDLASLLPHLQPVELEVAKFFNCRTSPSSTATLSSVGSLQLSRAVVTNVSELALSAPKARPAFLSCRAMTARPMRTLSKWLERGRASLPTNRAKPWLRVARSKSVSRIRPSFHEPDGTCRFFQRHAPVLRSGGRRLPTANDSSGTVTRFRSPMSSSIHAWAATRGRYRCPERSGEQRGSSVCREARSSLPTGTDSKASANGTHHEPE